jgi:hypothetical protein
VSLVSEPRDLANGLLFPRDQVPEERQAFPGEVAHKDTGERKENY